MLHKLDFMAIPPQIDASSIFLPRFEHYILAQIFEHF